MLPAELKRIVTAFADEQADVDVRQGRLVAQIHDELVDVNLLSDPATGELQVVEHDRRQPAIRWILSRIARMPQLADRILSYVQPTEHFVMPAGRFRDDITKGADDDKPVEDVVAALRARLSTPLFGTTSVLYLTSDAGEGKTTLINQTARFQAEQFKRKQTTWLLVPIPLGGKAFLNFDDVVIAALVNRLRFTHYYYDGFLELVRLNAIVPAFDGFEEMFIEGSSGEAISALGNLIGALDSSGAVVVAARKAFFEYQSFRTQAILFDSIANTSASFSRMGILRWGKREFLDYAIARGEESGEEIYNVVATRMGRTDHPLLTRAVLVKRLFDIVGSVADTEELLEKLGHRPQDYFFNFVNAIVQREAVEKWLNKAGDAQEPLLSIDEHHRLLGMIAREMWQSSTFSLRYDLIDIIVDLFIEETRKGPVIGRQVRERIRQHSLLVVDSAKPNALAFDHDDFREFFLGEALGQILLAGPNSDVYLMLSVGYLPQETFDQALQCLIRNRSDTGPIVKMLVTLAQAEGSLSFARENVGGLLIRILDGAQEPPEGRISAVAFPANSLVGRSLTRVTFDHCYFQPTGLDSVRFANVVFDQCEFERLECASNADLTGMAFSDCKIGGLVLLDSDTQFFSPESIYAELHRLGADVSDGASPIVKSRVAEDARIKQLERFLRIFLRTTQVDEETIRIRLGKTSNEFFVNMLPALLRAGILVEVPHRGSGVQRRFRLATRMQDVQASLANANGDLDKVLHLLGRVEA